MLQRQAVRGGYWRGVRLINVAELFERCDSLCSAGRDCSVAIDSSTVIQLLLLLLLLQWDACTDLTSFTAL